MASAHTVPVIPAPSPIDVDGAQTPAKDFVPTAAFASYFDELVACFERMAYITCTTQMPVHGRIDHDFKCVSGAGGLPSFLEYHARRANMTPLQADASLHLGSLAAFMFAAGVPDAYRQAVLQELHTIIQNLGASHTMLTAGLPAAVMRETLIGVSLRNCVWGNPMDCVHETRRDKKEANLHGKKDDEKVKEFITYGNTVAAALDAVSKTSALTEISPELKQLESAVSDVPAYVDIAEGSEEEEEADLPADAAYQYLHNYPMNMQDPVYVDAVRMWTFLTTLVAIPAAIGAPKDTVAWQTIRDITADPLAMLFMMYRAAQEVSTVEAGTSRAVPLTTLAIYMGQRMGVPYTSFLSPTLARLQSSQREIALKDVREKETYRKLTTWPYTTIHKQEGWAAPFWDHVHTVAWDLQNPQTVIEKKKEKQPEIIRPLPAAATAAPRLPPSALFPTDVPRVEPAVSATDPRVTYIQGLLTAVYALNDLVLAFDTSPVYDARNSGGMRDMAVSYCLLQAVHAVEGTLSDPETDWSQPPRQRVQAWMTGSDAAPMPGDAELVVAATEYTVAQYMDGSADAAEVASKLVTMCMGATHNAAMEMVVAAGVLKSVQ